MFENGFGNARVTGLKEVTLPESVSMTPETIGWWILGGIVLAWFSWFGYVWYRRWQANRYRDAALEELSEIERLWSQGDPAGLIRLPVLLKRTAMHAFGREHAADLTGTPWLAFLDKTGATTDFTRGPGRILIDMAYKTTETIADENIPEVLMVAREWIWRHRKRSV
ncbi:DUF4381 domain-containing protein [Planctomycetota bacterium]